MRTVLSLCLVLIFLGGCATLCRHDTLESTAFLKGSLATTINQQAIDYHRKHLSWPDAQYLAKHAGLAVHNRFYQTKLSVYILDKPYHSIPDSLDSSQTFAFCAYYSPIDSSRYVCCRIYYQNKKHCFTSSSGDGVEASIWSLVMEAESHLLDFLKQAKQVSSEAEVEQLAGEHAQAISEISPNQSSQDELFGLSYPVFVLYHQAAQNLDPASPEFALLLDTAARRLGQLIYYQDWKNK